MTKKALSNHSSVVALACILGVTACTMEVGEENSSGEYGSVSQPLQLVSDTLPTSGTKHINIMSNPGEDAVVIMHSPSSGNWQFTIDGSPIGADGCYTGNNAVFTYWTDDLYGGWNEWPGGGGICWPTSFWSTNLYSGSSDISYKFLIQNYTSWPGPIYGETVHLHFTKL